MVVRGFKQLIFTGKLPSSDNAGEEGHHTDGELSESGRHFEGNTNEFDAINVLCLSHQMKR